jgi:hypothetical protein
VLGSGMGSCSTMETKYRYRWKGEGRNKARTENPDIADVYNTCLKMGVKRAQIAATLTVTGASDIFAPEPEDDDDPKDDAPQHEPTAREIMLRECGLLCGKLGGDAQTIREIFAAVQLPLGRTLQQFSDVELIAARNALTEAAERQQRQAVKP